MISRVITLVLVAVAVSATASAQERLPRAPEVAPNPKAANAPEPVVVRRAPTLDLLRRVTVTRGPFGLDLGNESSAPLNRTFMVVPSDGDNSRPIDLLSGFEPAPADGAGAKAGMPKRVVVRRAPTLDLMTRVTMTRGLAGKGRIRGVPLDLDHLKGFWRRPGGSTLPVSPLETGG